MSMVTKVAKMRLFFHANMLDICNVAKVSRNSKRNRSSRICGAMHSTRSEITEVSENIEYVCE